MSLAIGGMRGCSARGSQHRRSPHRAGRRSWVAAALRRCHGARHCLHRPCAWTARGRAPGPPRGADPPIPGGPGRDQVPRCETPGRRMRFQGVARVMPSAQAAPVTPAAGPAWAASGSPRVLRPDRHRRCHAGFLPGTEGGQEQPRHRANRAGHHRGVARAPPFPFRRDGRGHAEPGRGKPAPRCASSPAAAACSPPPMSPRQARSGGALRRLASCQARLVTGTARTRHGGRPCARPDRVEGGI